MQKTRTNARYTVLAAIVTVLLLQTQAVAAVPELAVTPETIDRTDNQSIPANVGHPVNVTFTNQNDTKTIYNVTLPDRPWLSWSRNIFDLNASTSRIVTATVTPQEAGTITDQFDIPYRYNQTGLNESQFGRSWQLTFDKNFYPSMQVMVDAHYRNTTVELTSLDEAFTLKLGEQGESVFKITNTGDETAYDIRLSGDNLSFDKADGFDIAPGDETLIPFTVTIPRPQINPSEATNTTYQPTIQITGQNINDTTFPVTVTVPYQNFTTVEEEEQDIDSLLDQFKEFCETNNCSAVQRTVYRNRTVYVNQTPVYEANLTEDQMQVLANLTEIQTENWEAVRDEQNLLKQSVNTRIENLTTELNELEQRNERETRQLRRAIKSLNQTVAQKQQLEVQRQQDTSRLGWAIVILLAVLGVIATIYYVVTRYMGEDWRLIPQ